MNCILKDRQDMVACSCKRRWPGRKSEGTQNGLALVIYDDAYLVLLGKQLYYTLSAKKYSAWRS